MDPAIRERFNDRILHDALRRFDLPAPDVTAADGFESFIFRVRRAGEPLILRLGHTRRRSPDQIHGEVDWINFLAAGGATVSAAVPSPRGALVEAIDDGRGGHFLATTFRFAPGRPPWEAGWSPALYETYGRLIGRMHALTRRYTPAQAAWRRPDWIDATDGELQQLLRPDEAAIGARYRALVEGAQRLPRDADAYGLVHFDAHSANLHVDDAGVITLFDFDDCAYNWFANDIAMVIFYMVANTPDPAQGVADFMPSFLAGYRTENRLDPGWLDHIPAFLKLREIDLYAAILRGFDVTPDTIDAIPNDWARSFMRDRRRRIEAGVAFVPFDFRTLAPHL